MNLWKLVKIVCIESRKKLPTSRACGEEGGTCAVDKETVASGILFVENWILFLVLFPKCADVFFGEYTCIVGFLEGIYRSIGKYTLLLKRGVDEAVSQRCIY